LSWERTLSFKSNTAVRNSEGGQEAEKAPGIAPHMKNSVRQSPVSSYLKKCSRFYGTLMFLLLEKLLPVLSQAFTTSKCDPDPIGTSVSIKVLLGEWNTSLKSR
jgi:hypothetical protein